MATAREHFALDWIKADLLETLNEARVALDDYAEQAGDEMRMRVCLTSLHQVHGTLVMLELKGVTQLADHLEQLAQALLAKQVTDSAAAGQALMQGILELPGYLDELQRGGEDSVSTSMPLVNEIRSLLAKDALVDPAGSSLREGATPAVIARFNAIGGPDKVVRMRSAYQNVLLAILKGEDRSVAVGTLSKIAVGLEKVTAGAPLARQWQAFAEFVTSLKQHTGVLESEAVKLLRRVDLEIKNLAKDGDAALRRPVNMDLVQQLLDGAIARDNRSETVTGLQEAVARDISNNTLAISGRQALGSAAQALQEDLNVIKDKMDLLVRSGSIDLEELRSLASPLKQIGSTLSLLGFESSREIVSDQVDAIENLIVLGDQDPKGVQSIAGALIQIDENLSSIVQGSGQSEVEQITGEAQQQVLREARKDLDHIKQCIVDFVTAHWSIGHLESVPVKLREISGALEIVPLPRAIDMLKRVNNYVQNKLMQGHRPEWAELDQFADVVSAIDYYLERLADETSSGAEDILIVAERSLTDLESKLTEVEIPAAAVVAAEELAEVTDADVQITTEIEPEPAELLTEAEAEVEPEAEAQLEPEAEVTAEAQPETKLIENAPEDVLAEVISPADDLAVSSTQDEPLDTENLPTFEEPKLALEQDAGFDLSSDEFADLEGAIEESTDNDAYASASDRPPAEHEEVAETEAVAQAESQPADVEPFVTSEPATSEPEPALELPDPEIVEIFVEEVDEVLETIGEYLPQWAQGFDNHDALAEVRRAFHTLKGSGRIVQAVAIGELAWGIENMLNRVIDGTVTANEQFVAAIDAARLLVPSLRDAFEQGQPGDLEAIGLIIDQADVLSSGGEIDIAVFNAAAAEPTPDFAIEAAPEVSEVSEEATQVDVEELQSDDVIDDLAPLEMAADEIDSLETEALTAEGTVEDLLEADTSELESQADEGPDRDASVLETIEFEAPELESSEIESGFDLETLFGDTESAEEEAEELSTVDLFVGEALEHLAVLQAENTKVPWQLSEGIARAFHTLTGGAALAELAEVQLIVDPAYQVVEAYRHAESNDQLQAFFVQAAAHLADCLSALKSHTDWEEPLEFVAAADDLLALRESSPRGMDRLLDSKATGALFDAEDELEAYLAKTSSADDSVGADSKSLQTTLLTLSELAIDANANDMSVLATALQQALAKADDCARIPMDAATTLREGYQQIIDQLNEVAAGTRPAPQDALVAALQNLDLAQPEMAEPVETQPEVEPTPTPTDNVAEVSEDDQEILDLAEIDADLIQVFFEEAEEICEALESSILSWSTERDNRLYMENMLRGLHTLKGGARLCGLVKLGDLAHDFESIVIEVQSDERPIDDGLFVELNRRFDEITHRLTQVTEQTNAPVPETAETVSVKSTDNVVELPTAPAEHQPVEPSVSDVNKIVESVVTPAAPARPVDADGELPASTIVERKVAKAEGSVGADRGNQEMVRVGSALLEELVNLAGESSILRARIEQGMSDFTGALDEMETTIERLREQLRRLEIETETQILYRHERSDGPQYENFDPLEMDRYNQLQQLSRGLSESASDMLDLKETLLFKARESETLLLQQARINTELQEGLMRTRMVPFSRLLPRLRRIVRQVSGELNKEVEFHVQNAEGELDRNLLERMVPPLEHMLRNAVDHGIESTEERRNYGKAATGRIDLRLTREGGDVVIEISDDGAGIDVEGVRAKALERGLVAADANLSDEDALQFVLAPGFSTAKSVTQISGRGVGLDVVHSEVKQLGGSVNIVSRPGKGTRFVIRVPFTVSVNRALMVSVAEDLYAIPLNTIEGIVLLSPDQLQALYSSEGKTFEYAGVPYRVRYLGQYLGREYRGPAAGQGSVPMVLVRSGDHAVAIHVDQVQGSREIVVKSLGPQFAGVGGISGATILGDGSVVVILDLLALIRAQHHESARRNSSGYAHRSGPRCVMVVDDSVTVRKVTSRLLERQGMDVLVAKDGVEAVAMLQERRPDVMLLDIEMPRMDGFEVARQVRHDERLSNLPIVMISSRTGDKHKEHASQLGVNKFLGKPFQENELLATIDELVAPN